MQVFADVGLPDLRLRQALRAFPTVNPDVSVPAIVSSAGLSDRQAQRAFAQRIGLTPKELQRLYRFRAVARAMGDAPSATLAAVASAGGYADQGHLTREFKEFAGTSPSRYHAKLASAMYLGRPPTVGNVQEARPRGA